MPLVNARGRVGVAMGVLSAAVCAAWAWWPLPTGTAAVPEPIVRRVTAQAARAPLDLRAFDARLWPVPPAPVAAAVAPPPPPPPAPLRLQLLAIIRGGETGVPWRAALYDPEGDTLHIVAPGEMIRARTVKLVTEAAVELTDGRMTHRLELEPPAKRGGS